MAFRFKDKVYGASYLLTGEFIALNSFKTVEGNWIINIRDIAATSGGVDYIYNYGNSNNSRESCAGRHYRIMMDVIGSNGDLQFLCDMLGNRCNLAVYSAAQIHCMLRH